MQIIFILALLSTISCGQTRICPGNVALRFGQTIDDYIQLPNGIMDHSRNKFSLCTWIKKRFSESSHPMVLHNADNIMLGQDSGYQNQVVGESMIMKSKYNRTVGTWFHLCVTWSTEDRTARVYLDGAEVGSRFTRRNELNMGSSMCLGNLANRETKFRDHVFGGDIFRMDIYNRVLNDIEIESLASDGMCSLERKKFATIKVLSWGEILTMSHETSGNVTDYSIECEISQIQCRLEDIKNELKESINKTLQLEIQLQREEQDRDCITEPRRKLARLRHRMQLQEIKTSERETLQLELKQSELHDELLRRLQISEKKLAGSRNKLNGVATKLQNTEEELEISEFTARRSKKKQGKYCKV